jgi:2-polyprenyl-3-methyl-5-hydroxy-6-metoxy-1,4-benzoquinol methylase
MDANYRELTMEYTGERMVPEFSDPDTFWEHIHRYRFASKWVKGKRVLDIASGEGYGSFGLLSTGAKSVVGIDIDENSCTHAKQKYGIDARVGSAEDIPLESGSIDVVVSFETIEHVPHPERFILEAFRVLAPGGTLIISTPETRLYSPSGNLHNPYHCSEMTSEQFQTLLGKAFSRIELFGQHPKTARWWSPMSLISESTGWDRLPTMGAMRKGIWARWNPRSVSPVPEADRQDPASLILSDKRSLLERTADWSAVRHLGRLGTWNPLYLVAVAQKENQ